MALELKRGDKVKVHPQGYPGQVYDGEVLRRAKYGWSVKYVLNGMGLKEVFSERELEAA